MMIDTYEFALVCPINPRRCSDGALQEFLPQSRYKNAGTAPINRHGKGPFCKFTIPSSLRTSGVYAITSGTEVKYIGECLNLSSRYNMGYGNISPRNCFVGGQETNCRINNLILDEARTGADVSLWFLQTSTYKLIEQALRRSKRPPWNRV